MRNLISNPMAAILGACALIAIATLGGGANAEERRADAPPAAAVCGNAIMETGEECDGGHQCDATCKLKAPVCGNGKQEVSAKGLPAEECDLGPVKNGMPGVECSTVCTTKSLQCGNGKLDKGETCDWGPNNGLKDAQ